MLIHILKSVPKVDSRSNDKIEEVMFLSESGSDLEKKTSHSENDASVHNGVKKEKNEEEKANKEESDGTEEEFDPEKDIMLLSCTEEFQGIRFFFIIMKYRNYQRCSRNQYRLMLHLMFHLLERSVKLCKDVR